MSFCPFITDFNRLRLIRIEITFVPSTIGDRFFTGRKFPFTRDTLFTTVNTLEVLIRRLNQTLKFQP